VSMAQTSLIATVYNDREGTELFLARMEEQTRRPDEIIVCDAGSTDGTWELLRRYEASGAIPLVALQERKCRPARGRNLAASMAQHATLTVTDIGCGWEPQWLEELVAPFDSIADLEAVMGSWKVRWEDQQTHWAKADYALQNGLELRATPRSHAANRAIAYRKDFYFRLGGLPEDLSFAADDMTFALLIQNLGTAIAAAPEPRCYWLRPQSLGQLLREARRNFRGNGEAGIGLKHFVLVGGRLIAELLGALIVPIGLALHLPVAILIAAAVLPAGSIFLRALRWREIVRRFGERGCAVSPVHLAVLDYLSRWYGLRGYMQGMVHGFRHCMTCRVRLRSAKISWA